MASLYFVHFVIIISTTTVIMTECVSVLVNITRKRSYIWRARKSDNYKGDDKEKQFLIDLLWSDFGIASIRPEPILTTSGKHRFPDLRSTNTNPIYYFELDGEYHGSGDDISTSAQTWERNRDYDKLGYRLIVINKEATDGYDKKKVRMLLKSAFGIYGFNPSK